MDDPLTSQQPNRQTISINTERRLIYQSNK